MVVVVVAAAGRRWRSPAAAAASEPRRPASSSFAGVSRLLGATRASSTRSYCCALHPDLLRCTSAAVGRSRSRPISFSPFSSSRPRAIVTPRASASEDPRAAAGGKPDAVSSAVPDALVTTCHRRTSSPACGHRAAGAANRQFLGTTTAKIFNVICKRDAR